MANSESGSSDDEDTAIPIITPEEVVVLPTENRLVAIKQISPVAIAPSTCLVPAPSLPMYKLIPTQFNLQITEELLRKNGILSGGQEPIQPGQGGTHQRKRESEQEEGGSEKQQKRESGQEGGGPEEKPKNESGQEGGTSGQGNSSHNHYNYSGPLLIGGQLFHMNYEEVTTTTIKKCTIRR